MVELIESVHLIERLVPTDETLKRRRMGMTPSKKTDEEMR